MYKVKMDVDMFTQGKSLYQRTHMLASMAQNDMEITEEDLKKFDYDVNELIADIDTYRQMVIKHIKGNE